LLFSLSFFFPPLLRVSKQETRPFGRHHTGAPRYTVQVTPDCIGNCLRQLLISFPVVGCTAKYQAQKNTTNKEDKTSTSNKPNKQARKQRQLEQGCLQNKPRVLGKNKLERKYSNSLQIVPRKYDEKEIYKTKPRKMASLKKFQHAKVVTPVEPRISRTCKSGDSSRTTNIKNVQTRNKTPRVIGP